jgi:hypothetical protein
MHQPLLRRPVRGQSLKIIWPANMCILWRCDERDAEELFESRIGRYVFEAIAWSLGLAEGLYELTQSVTAACGTNGREPQLGHVLRKEPGTVGAVFNKSPKWCRATT